MFWESIQDSYADFLTRDRKRKFNPKPTVLHQKTCPICGRNRVNIYYSYQLNKYVCKKCIDEKGECVE